MSKNLYFAKTHEWVEITDGIAKIGISDYAQNELGDIVFLDIQKKVGDEVVANKTFSTIESVKAVSDIYSPLTGTIVEINQKVIDNPELINSSPFEEGWLVKLQISNKVDLQELLDESSYKKYIAEE